MSSKVVIDEIKRFLESAEPEVLCIQGKWGVGKTFAWKKYLDESRREERLALNRHAYVSLFGINHLNDLRQSIFENTYEKDIEDSVGLNPNLTSKLNNLKKILLRSGVFSKHIDGLDRLAFLLVRKQIVCIDDLERVGGSLSISDVLGLVSFLKTERQCKVVILMNDGELSKGAAEIFEKQKEKVTDIVLTFEPTASEAADIVFSSPSETQELIRKNTILLGITNIRVIKKIERNCARLLEILQRYPDLHFQAIHSTILFTWSTLQPTEAPSIDFIQKFRQYRFLDKEKNTDEDEKRWGSLLTAYQYFHTDELDLLIVDGIKRGYFSSEEFGKIAEKSNAAAIKGKNQNSISSSWDAFHGSFKDNEKDVLDGIYNANIQNVDVLTPSNLNSAVKVLKEFDRKDQAISLIAKYIEVRGSEQELFDLKKYTFREDVNDEDIVMAFNKQSATFKDDRDPATVLEDMVRNKGWNQEDIELVQKLTPDDFFKMFRSLEGDRMYRAIEGALQFRRIQGIPEDTKMISSKATEALLRIGKENRLNKKRIAAYGIKIDDQPE